MEENPENIDTNAINNEKEGNLNSIKYTSQLSKELLESQVETFRSFNNKAGVILNILALFIPVYLFIIDHSNIIIKWLSVLVILLLIFGIISMLFVLNVYTLHIGSKEDKYDDFINMSEVDIYLFEIAANKESIELNQNGVLKKQNWWYEKGTKSVIISVISATILLTFSIFNKTERPMPNQEEKSDNKMKDENNVRPKIILPVVPKSELKQIKNLDTTINKTKVKNDNEN